MYITCSLGGHRGVQYVHWVMHKCIMVKVEEKRNTQKYVKNRWISWKQGEIFKSRGE